MGYNLMGIGPVDLAAGCAFLKELNPDGSSMVSASLYCGNRPAFSPFRIFHVKGIRIAVLGISGGKAPSWIPNSDNVTIKDSDPAIERYMSKIAQNADMIVLLSSMPASMEARFMARHPGIALVISSSRTAPTYTPVKHGGALTVSTHPRGKSVGIIRLYLKRDQAGHYTVDHYNNRIYMLE